MSLGRAAVAETSAPRGSKVLGRWRLVLLGAVAIAVAGCGSARWSAPVEGRGGGQVITGTTYRVKPGDTLQAIATRASIDHNRIAEWNQLASPDRIYVGQVLRLTPPADTGARPPARPPAEPAARVAEHASVSAEPQNKPAGSRPDVLAGGGNLRWQWPTSGRVVERFAAGDPARKGVKISGKPGQAIRAAERGEVVYSGSGLVGYGPLIIIKHNNNYLSAYGHNRKLLVQQGDQVIKGTEIAEMGLAGGTPLLHFEIRRDGDPVDPLALLPRR